MFILFSARSAGRTALGWWLWRECDCSRAARSGRRYLFEASGNIQVQGTRQSVSSPVSESVFLTFRPDRQGVHYRHHCRGRWCTISVIKPKKVFNLRLRLMSFRDVRITLLARMHLRVRGCSSHQAVDVNARASHEGKFVPVRCYRARRDSVWLCYCDERNKFDTLLPVF
jgi:hypothetical protein